MEPEMYRIWRRMYLDESLEKDRLQHKYKHTKEGDIQVPKTEVRDMGESKHFLIAKGDNCWKESKKKSLFRWHPGLSEWTSLLNWWNGDVLKLLPKWLTSLLGGEKNIEFVNADEERTGNTFKSCHLLCCLETLWIIRKLGDRLTRVTHCKALVLYSRS